MSALNEVPCAALTHYNTAYDIGANASSKSSEPFFSTDSHNGIKSVRITESLCRQTGPIGAHPHKAHLE